MLEIDQNNLINCFIVKKVLRANWTKQAGRAASLKYRSNEVKYSSKEKGGDDSTWKGSVL